MTRLLILLTLMVLLLVIVILRNDSSCSFESFYNKKGGGKDDAKMNGYQLTCRSSKSPIDAVDCMEECPTGWTEIQRGSACTYSVSALKTEDPK